MTELINYFLALTKANPGFSSMILGTSSGWAIATLTEYFLASTWLQAKTIKQIVVFVTVVACGIATELLWGVFDSLSDPHMRRVVCYFAAPIAPFTYVLVAKIASHYVPWINSIWSLDSSKE